MTAFHFSVDVEEVDTRDVVGVRGASRLIEMTARYLEFLRRHEARGTFFVTGQVARTQPSLVQRISAEGHEVGCHSNLHAPLAVLGPELFRQDCASARSALEAAGAKNVSGYRAPCFSLTNRTPWAHAILAELGFSYSSSVLPAPNPLNGWPGFGLAPRLVDGVTELPISLFSARWLPLPAGGVYFRALPAALIYAAFRAKAKAGVPVLGYFHPYDIDSEQERIAHPGFSRGSPYNWLMYRNRKQLLGRLSSIAELGFRFEPYGPYAKTVRAELTAGVSA